MILHARSIFLLVLGLALAAVGCSNGGASLTELVVLVRADVPVPDLHVRITGPDGTTRVDEHFRAPTFPLSIVLTRDHAPYGPVAVHVEGSDVVSDAITELVPGERRRFEVWLSDSCRCVSCAASETCRGGACEDRRVAGTTLPVWIPGTDAGVAAPRDAGGARDAGPPPDGGTCGCQGQACCAGACHGTLSCRADVCMDCQLSMPTATGSTGTVTNIPAVSATGDTIWVSVTHGTAVDQIGLALTGGVRANGTAPALGELRGMTTTSNTITLLGTGTTSGRLDVTGSTMTGSFVAAGTAHITSVSAAGNVITLTASDGATGTISFVQMEVCR